MDKPSDPRLDEKAWLAIRDLIAPAQHDQVRSYIARYMAALQGKPVNLALCANAAIREAELGRDGSITERYRDIAAAVLKETGVKYE